jgi:hypothetical protein
VCGEVPVVAVRAEIGALILAKLFFYSFGKISGVLD